MVPETVEMHAYSQSFLLSVCDILLGIVKSRRRI